LELLTKIATEAAQGKPDRTIIVGGKRIEKRICTFRFRVLIRRFDSRLRLFQRVVWRRPLCGKHTQLWISACRFIAALPTPEVRAPRERAAAIAAVAFYGEAP
jgi:hypothetical protein